MATSLKVLLPYYAVSGVLLLAFGFFKLVHLVPFTHRALETMIRKLATIKMQKEDYWKGIFGLQMFKTYQKTILQELQREAYVGNQTPNPQLVSVDGSTTHRLLDVARGSRPLVVNFGSCTCPVFMARLREFGEIVEEFSSVADFLTVYIAEAHPTDEWRLKNNIEILQHQTQDDRCKAAQALLTSGKLKTKLMVDTIENAANRAFAAMPIRLYIIEDEKIQYAGGIGPTFYKIGGIKKWLETRHYSDANNNDLADTNAI